MALDHGQSVTLKAQAARDHFSRHETAEPLTEGWRVTSSSATRRSYRCSLSILTVLRQHPMLTVRADFERRLVLFPSLAG
jgi:hypothetical protein